MNAPPQITRSRQPQKTRARILQAAAAEFSSEGLAGARTERIAQLAGVNKALIHYYFKDKETLYAAVLDSVFSGLYRRMREVLSQDRPPREKLLAWAGAHFDYIAASPIYPRLVQRELMRAGGSPLLRRIVHRYLRPLAREVFAALGAGMRAGEFRRLSPHHFLLSIVAMNVFYFSSAHMIALLSGHDPLTPERVAERRAAVLDVVAAALFTHAARQKRAGPAPKPRRAHENRVRKGSLTKRRSRKERS